MLHSSQPLSRKAIKDKDAKGQSIFSRTAAHHAPYFPKQKTPDQGLPAEIRYTFFYIACRFIFWIIYDADVHEIRSITMDSTCHLSLLY